MRSAKMFMFNTQFDTGQKLLSIKPITQRAFNNNLNKKNELPANYIQDIDQRSKTQNSYKWH